MSSEEGSESDYNNDIENNFGPWKFQETNKIIFLLNGTKITVDTTTITPKTTLNEYLRKNLHLTGTKYMCMEGGCGACIVSATFTNLNTNTKETKAINSCLVTILMVEGWEITTVEGLGNRIDGYNEIQEKVVQFNATQCGFCTPGMVMNMYSLKESGVTKMHQIENSFGGNLCRCTGYRPILSAFKSMATDADESILGIVRDIEDLKRCSNNENCSKKCLEFSMNDEIPSIIMTNHNHVNNNVTSADNWYKVSKIKDIFAIFRRNSRRTYQLVSGNTAKGVYKDISNRDYFIDISGVKELQGYSHNTSKLILGGNMTLSETMQICQKVSEIDDGFKHLAKVATHLDVVAHVPVRNIGTLAGNLAMKYTYNEFPSDIFLLLETIDAVLVIDNGRRLRKISPSEFLDFDMNKKIIRSIEIPTLDNNYQFDSYKIMKRAQNAHAIINAGFLIKFKKNVVDKCTIVFGGVNSTFIHASKTEKLIKGKVLFDNKNLQSFFAKLQSEIKPDNTLPEPSPEFRRKLCISLFYKFVLSITPNELISPRNKSGASKLVRPSVSTGVQDYKTKESMYPVGEPIHKIEAAAQTSGELKYVTDEADNYGQCFAVFVQGKAVPGSVLKLIDASTALKLEGVEGFFQASDVPGVNSFTIPNKVLEFDDEEIFLGIGDKLKYYFQPVGIIVANSQEIADAASKLVKVTFDSTKTEPVLTTTDALKHPDRIKHFNTWMPKNQNDAPIKFEGVFESLPQYHNHMELQVASVNPGDNGNIKIHIGTQWINSVQSSVSRSMNIPAHKINVEVKWVGGSFGGKVTRANWMACAATLAAIKLRKPVKLFMSLEANMNIIGKRHSIRSTYNVGVDKNGVFGSLNTNLYCNTGVYRNSAIEEFMVELYEGPYVTDTFYTELDIVKTDNSAATYMRSPGYMEGSAIIETIMDHIACKLDKDPIDVRLANLKNDNLLKKIINDTLEWSDYRKRRSAIEKFNQENIWRKKGISLVPMAYALTGLSPYFAQVSIYQSDGTVAITHGGIEIGQGINTKAAQVVAYVLGIDFNMVSVLPSNNFTTPNNFVTAGSVTTESICMALNTACTSLITRINQAATDNKLPSDSPWLKRVQTAHANGLSLTENAIYAHDQTNPTIYVVYGASVSEIELDVLTGQIIVQRADLVEDTGDSLNPFIDIGQVEGAYMMGLGHWTSEELIYDNKGALKTNNTWNYKIPGVKDIPVDMRVKFPDGIPNPLTPFKNKATSEPPFCLAFSVPLAIKHALKSVRTQFDKNLDPWATMDGPCSLEWIFMNSNHDIKQYEL